MKKIIFMAAIAGVTGIALMAFRPANDIPAATRENNEAIKPYATKWVVDKAHSNVGFTITHMVISEVEGSFKLFDGSMETGSATDFSEAKVSFTVDVSSINTNNDGRDKHLKSADFFDAEKYPQMKFVSSSMKPLGGNKYKMDGQLTIRDVTKPVSFDVTYGGSINTQRGAKAGFKAKTTINRFDYGLKWDRATETGGLVVSKEVDITVNVQMSEMK